MRRTASALGLIIVAFVVAAGAAFGQGLTPKKIWDLTIVVNAPNAVIYVDNVLVQGNTTKVAGGAHNVRVHADGYRDFNGPVNVGGNMRFPVNLTPLGFPLTLRAVPPNARVFVDGADVTGTAPLVAPGNHTLQVTVAGFQDYTATITVNGPLTINVPPLRPAGFALTLRAVPPNARVFVDGTDVTGTVPLVAPGNHTLQVTVAGFVDYTVTVTVNGPLTVNVPPLRPAGFLLTVNANVPNATVTVNNMARGAVPYSESLQPGTYSVRVSADGYQDYTTTVTLNNGSVPLNVQLQPVVLPSTLSFVVPPAFRDADDPTPLRIFIDNRPISGRDTDRIPVTPGRHTVRVASGAFSVQLGELVVQPGMSYIVELSMAMNVRPVPATR